MNSEEKALDPQLSQVVANVVTYNAAISACEKVGHWQMAVFLFSVMAEAGMHHRTNGSGSWVRAWGSGLAVWG